MPLLSPDQDPNEMLQAVMDELRKGAVQKKHPFNKMVFSTVSGDQAASRWVVFRKLTAENHFLIFTDARSEKVEELRQNPKATLLFYHHHQGVQVRVHGRVSLHHGDELTSAYWPGVKGSPGAKSYQTLQSPGNPTFTIQEGNSTNPELEDQYFMVISVVAQQIEALQLDREQHIRVSFEKEGDQWKGSFLVP